MDSYEATRIVFTKIQTLDPEHASKIMGLLLIQDHGEKEMIRLAFGPESLLHSVILKSRKELGISSPPTPSTPSSPSPFAPHNLSRQNSPNSSTASRLVNGGITNLPSPLSIPSPSSYSPLNSSAPPYELQIHDQLSFLNDGGDMFSPWDGGGAHRRSSSVNDICFGAAGGGSCRFTHGGDGEADFSAVTVGYVMERCHEVFRSNSGNQQRLLAAATTGGSPNFPFPNSPKSMNYLLQQQSGSPRMATAAAALMVGEEMNKTGRSRNDFPMGLINHASRQIYLTFPADSLFTEEDVSNYFSVYGPVQDVRIPYQQKRMFGFVSFAYAETVKLILAKGNPHFVCEARVLVKPYKEKGKVPDKFRKQPQQHMESPTGFDSHDPFDLQLGSRTLFNNQDLLWWKKLEEQADLQHAIELQNRRIMDLQLLDVKRNHHHQRTLSTGACYSPSYLNHSSVFASDSRSSSSPDSEDGLISNLAPPVTINGDKPPLKASLNLEKEKDASDFKDENNNAKSSPRREDDINFPESLEHNLPDSLFASPKRSGDHQTVFSNDKNTLASSATSNSNLITSPLTSTLDMASLKSCYFQFPRLSSDHGAIGM